MMHLTESNDSTPMDTAMATCENVVTSIVLYQQIKEAAALSTDTAHVKAAQDMMLVVYCALPEPGEA